MQLKTLVAALLVSSAASYNLINGIEDMIFSGFKGNIDHEEKQEEQQREY